MDLLAFAAGMRGALYQCGQVARGLLGRVTVEEKAPDSVHQQSLAISVVDRLCQELLFLRAYELAPYLEINSEEIGDLPPALGELFAGNRHRYALVLDPVDGTEDYVRGQRSYAHMLALLNQETERVDCGLVYFPQSTTLYVGLRGMGAYAAEGLWAPLRPIETGLPPRTVGQTKRTTPADYAAMAAQGFCAVPAESRSAAWELMRVARGQLGAMVMRHFHGHDTAPLSVIIEELGGLVLDERGEPVRYAQEMPRTPLVISSLSPEYARTLAELLGAAE